MPLQNPLRYWFLAMSMGMVLLCHGVVAQTYHISGQVTDVITGEPVPFTNIFFKGPKAGTTTNFDGKYSITINEPADSIIASSLGYASKSVLFVKKPDQVVNFKLERSSVTLDMVTVKPGENPADILMRKVIAHKDANNKNKLDRYNYEAYNKLEVDIFDIGDKFKNRKILKPFKFVFDYMDSTSEEKPFLPIFLSETLSDEYYRKDPKQIREVIKASKISGTKNESVSQFMGSMYQEVNVYDNWLGFLGKQFASPIMDGAFTYYKFYLVDSTVLDGHWCYKLNFVPKTKAYNTFQGDMWIADTSFAVKNINMQVSDHVNINYVEKSSLYQDFSEVVPGTWMIVKDKIVIQFKLTEKAAGLIGRKTTTMRDFKVGTTTMDTVFKDKQDIVIDDQALEKTDTFWEAHRHEELAKDEAGVYKMVDSLKNNKVFKTYVDIVNSILTGYYPVKYVEFGPYLSTIGLDDVEKFRLRVGMRTTKKLLDWMRIGGYGAYGFADHRWKYGFDGLVRPMNKPRLEIGGSYMHDLDLSSSSKADVNSDNILAGLVRRNVPQKLNMVDQWKVYLEKDWKYGVTTRIGFQNRRFDPQFAYNYLNPEGGTGTDSTLHKFTTTEVTFNLRFGYKEKFLTNDFDRISTGTDYPVLEVRYMAGIKNVLGSGFNYHRIELELSDHFPIHPIGKFYYDITFGKVFGTLPSQLLAVAPGNETFFYNSYAFNVLNQYEFITDQYVSIILQHHFEGFFLNHIPWVRKLKWRELVMFKGVFGTMTDANKALNRNIPFAIPFPKPYMEAGFGIENILKIIRVDVVFRITYQHNPATVNPPKAMGLVGLSIDL